jgi:hypothetical protein
VEAKELAIVRQQLGKHTPIATDMHATTELLEAVFSLWSVPRLYNEGQQGQ